MQLRHSSVSYPCEDAPLTGSSQKSAAAGLALVLLLALSACGASGVAGGSLLLIPLSCGLFGIANDVAMQVVAVGFVVGD